MCSRPNFEEEEQALDEAMIDTFDRWKADVLFWMGEDELKGVDCVEWFCDDVRSRLSDLLPKLR